MRKLPIILLLIALATAHVFLLTKAGEGLNVLPKGEDSSFVLPTPVLKIVTLDFHGIASDFLFLQALVFVGSTHERTERPRVKPWEWKWFYSMLDASTSLDPYFLDPYYFANGQLTWEALMIDENNRLLERGSTYREWDSTIPFYIGFNYFYFLQDNLHARQWLLEASKRPDAQPIYASIAAKLSYEKKRTENVISFLEEMLKTTEDENLKQTYENRLHFLRQVLQVENAVEAYKKKFGRKPADIVALVKSGLLHEIPADPQGGQLYLDVDGKVRGTSEREVDASHVQH
jgi:hypothetical protein